MITFKYFKEQRTLMVKLEGEVSVTELIEFFDTATASIDLPKQLNLLMDNRASAKNFSIEDTKSIREAAKKRLHHFTELRQALIIKTVQGTTAALFYKHISTHANFYFEVFTTYSAAVAWLNLDLSEHTFLKK